MAITKSNSNILMIFTFLEKFKELLLKHFFQIDQDTIRQNMIMVYEIMDEMMDNGYPQNTDEKLLKNYIKTANIMKGSKRKKKRKQQELVKAMTSSIPWRQGKFKYGKNESYLDVIEKINMVISQSGQVLKSEVEGVLHMKCRLSGTPELVLGLNDKKFFDLNHDKKKGTNKKTVDISDIKFH